MSKITFSRTPAAGKQPEAGIFYGRQTTSFPTIKNGVLLAEGPGSHSWNNAYLIATLLGVPFLINYYFGGTKYTLVVLTLMLAIPILMAFWSFNSSHGPALDSKTKLPNEPIEEYLEFLDPELARIYHGKVKIPLETFQENFIDGKIIPKGKRDILDVLELCHDWASFRFTWGLFKYFFLRMIPEVILHTRSQDEEQVRGHYDRGDDFYAAFLGPRMIYTGGIITDPTTEETLEELQDSKLRLVCEKLELKPKESLLDIGCGWGTLTAYATSIYGVKATGITLGRNQCAWGNKQIEKYAGPKSDSRILCLDYRDIPADSKYNKISCLEMAEHVGVRHFHSFMRQVYNLLDDDGLFFLQIVGMRKCWQFEDLIWGLFMNKYIFPGADATLPIGAVTEYLTGAGFEIKSVDNITVHYSATLWRWYRNWKNSKKFIGEKYGLRWYRIWELFLAWATIVARQGSAHAYQIVCNKDKNTFHRINGIASQHGTYLKPDSKKVEKWKQLTSNDL